MLSIARHFGPETQIRRLFLVSVLTSGYFVAEVIGGLVSNSLALISDAGHMIVDIGALGLATIAATLAAKPHEGQKTYGYHRTEPLAALLNGITLVAIDAYIFSEAFRRFLSPPVVEGSIVLIIAVGGLVVNLIGAVILRDASKGSLNVQAAFVHILTDALGSGAAIASGLIILTTGFLLADPIFAAIIGILLIPSIWRLLRNSIHILLESPPYRLRVDEVRKEIKGVDGVREVHELHVWSISTGFDSLSAHVVVDPQMDQHQLLTKINSILREKFGLQHNTIQLEVTSGYLSLEE